jgi:hypothetical protein
MRAAAAALGTATGRKGSVHAARQRPPCVRAVVRARRRRAVHAAERVSVCARVSAPAAWSKRAPPRQLSVASVSCQRRRARATAARTPRARRRAPLRCAVVLHAALQAKESTAKRKGGRCFESLCAAREERDCLLWQDERESTRASSIRSRQAALPCASVKRSARARRRHLGAEGHKPEGHFAGPPKTQRCPPRRVERRVCAGHAAPCAARPQTTPAAAAPC